MIQTVDKPNTTPIGQDRETLTFKALFYLNVAVHMQVCRLFCMVYIPLFSLVTLLKQILLLSGLLIFRAVAEPQISSKSANPVKFTKTRETPRNSLEILPNTCWHNIFESYLVCWGCLLAVNLLIYLETSSPQRVNNIPKRLAFLDYVAKNWEATM